MKFGLIVLTAAAVIAGGATAALAQGQTVPAGDSLAQTPPIDVTRQQLAASPYRHRVHHLRQGRSASIRGNAARNYRLTR